MTDLQLELAASAGKAHARAWPASDVDAPDRPQRRTPHATAVKVVTVAVAVLAASLVAVLLEIR